MNKRRRKVLHEVLNVLATLKDKETSEDVVATLKEASIQVERCADEEQDAIDNRPESLRWAASTDDMNDNVSDLYDAMSDIECALSETEDAGEYSFDKIKTDIANAVNKIKDVIHR